MIRIIKYLHWSLWLGAVGLACEPPQPPAQAQAPAFAAAAVLGSVQTPELTEASGLVAAAYPTDLLWAHNDSGGQPELFLLNTSGQHVGSLVLADRTNRDWEDLSRTTFADGTYLYVGDIGDNELQHTTYYIYRVKEPSSPPSARQSVASEKIAFRYADGPHDAEAMLIDHQTKDIYLVSKREAQSRLYKLPYPQSTTTTNVATYVLSLPFNLTTGGSTSARTQEVLLKNYFEIFYWKQQTQETFEAMLARPPLKLPYVVEPQGEAIAWGAGGTGFFTLSEGQAAKVYWYQKQ